MNGKQLLEVIEKGGLVYQNCYDTYGSNYSVRKFLESFATQFKLSQVLRGKYRVTIIIDPCEEKEEWE